MEQLKKYIEEIHAELKTMENSPVADKELIVVTDGIDPKIANPTLGPVIATINIYANVNGNTEIIGSATVKNEYRIVNIGDQRSVERKIKNVKFNTVFIPEIYIRTAAEKIAKAVSTKLPSVPTGYEKLLGGLLEKEFLAQIEKIKTEPETKTE